MCVRCDEYLPGEINRLGRCPDCQNELDPRGEDDPVMAALRRHPGFKGD